MDLLDKAKVNLQSLYDRLWGDWYAGIAGATKARLVVEQGIHAPGYSKNSIYLFLDGFDLDGAAEEQQHNPIADIRNMQSWQRDLIHEMMHEFQEKVASLTDPSDEGNILFAQHSNRFPGLGHDARFFTVVAMHAAYFGVKPDEFAAEL